MVKHSVRIPINNIYRNYMSLASSDAISPSSMFGGLYLSFSKRKGGKNTPPFCDPHPPGRRRRRRRKRRRRSFIWPGAFACL